jgi:hypothetical protein
MELPSVNHTSQDCIFHVLSTDYRKLKSMRLGLVFSSTVAMWFQSIDIQAVSRKRMGKHVAMRG